MLGGTMRASQSAREQDRAMWAATTAPGPTLHAVASVPVTDAALLDECRRGSSQAWDTLVARYERLIYSVALRNGLNSDDAADVTQQTFLALLESINHLREESRLASWLMTVARRQAWHQRERVGRETSLQAAPEGSENQSLAWERLATLHQMLQELGSPCRELLLALYFDPDEPSYATIARQMGRSVGGIGPLRGRCLDRARSILETED